MSDTDILLSVDAQPQKNEKQVTFSQEDFDQLAAAQLFDEQECLFIENLNVDAEEQRRDRRYQQQEQEYEMNEKKQQQQQEEDLDDLKMYVLKCIGRQDISQDVAAMESDFYDKVELVVDEMTENSFFRMETFINTRLERIIMYCKSYSQNVSCKLTLEESQLYHDLCESVRKYREKIDKRLNK